MKVVYSASDGHHQERLVLTTELPSTDLCSAVVVFAFKEDRILLNENKKWRLALPAGHIEAYETIEEAVHREAYEEAQVTLSRVGPIGYVHYHLADPKPSGYKYPYPDSYMVNFWAQIDRLDPFREDEETSSRGLFSLRDLGEISGVFRRISWDTYAAAFCAATGKAADRPLARV